MALWSKLRHFFGKTGVTVELDCPDEISASGERLAGRVRLSCGPVSRRILAVAVMLEETWTVGFEDDPYTREFELGRAEVLDEPFVLEPDEERTLPFELTFELLEAEHTLPEHQPEKSAFRVAVEVDVEGTPFDPTLEKQVRLVD